ncbi:gamma-glutamylcyclotransferase family protein [Chengkuizengella marina]|uniref:gamma-glutamylcyclotransferase family protein n=1 Tax=Chengkuizengella marina TaxID=2507566 RepID=UPI00136D1C58|nr:gamma-glutamylcyclotransferase family protein [Chengkuizengella marina]
MKHKQDLQKKSYYFAYGSCMNRNSFKGTVHEFEVLGRAELFNYRVGFTRESDKWGKGGIADILFTQDHIMEGILYSVPDHLIPELDRRERAGEEFLHPIYRRINVTVFFNEVHMNAFTYEVINKEVSEIAPSEKYKNAIIGGTDLLSRKYVYNLQAHMSQLMK